ncbi:NACHT domain-containing protein [Streptomyces sioyaensis]|uniref:NACHT domain-containing protein n=1 Tax=Streptomyces sioyaensis TaxID=67364 RepID=UPI0037D4B145
MRVGLRMGGRGRGRLDVRAGLEAEAQHLASAVYAQWQSEERRRRVHDPFPLNVRFRAAATEVSDHWARIRQAPPRADPGPPGEAHPLALTGRLDRIVEVYRSVPSRRLVVLGAPGAGKTILTLRFVLDWLDTRGPDDPVPVLFSLGSWDPARLSLRDWLCGRLAHDYGLAASAAQGGNLAGALVDGGWILPVLDGFDEIASGLQGMALRALSSTGMALLLTSRAAEYTEAVAHTDVLRAAAVVHLDDLTLDDLSHYLPRAGRPSLDGERNGHRTAWGYLLAGLREQPRSQGEVNLATALRTPLIVAMARTLPCDAPGQNPLALLDTGRFPTPEAVRQHLLAALVPVAYASPPDGRGNGPRRRRHWTPARAQHWLGYLAAHLNQRGTPGLAWWELGTTMRRSSRMLIVGFLAALAFGVTTGAGNLFADLTGTAHGLAFTLERGLATGLLAGLVAGPVFGLAYGLVCGAAAREPSQIRIPAGSGRTRGLWARAVPRGMAGLAFGLAAAVVWVLVDRFVVERPGFGDGLDGGFGTGLGLGIGAGLVSGFLAWLEAPLDLRSAAGPADVLHASRRNVVLHTLVWLLVLGFLAGLAKGPLAGLVFGIEGGLGYALSVTVWGQWAALARIWLPLTGRLPWAVLAFLDDACRRGVLRRAGAVYQFRDAQLQQHLAEHYQAHHCEAVVRENRMAAPVRRMPPWAILSTVVALLLLFSWAGTRDILEQLQHHGSLGPSDAPVIVTTIVSLATAVGALIGGTLTGISKYVQARGQAYAERTRADAEMRRAEADVMRARAGLPPQENPPNREDPAREPDAAE